LLSFVFKFYVLYLCHKLFLLMSQTILYNCSYYFVHSAQLIFVYILIFCICSNNEMIDIRQLRWEFIKENKKTRFRPRKPSRKNDNGQEKRKKTRSRPRKRPRKKRKLSLFFSYFLVFFYKCSPLLWTENLRVTCHERYSGKLSSCKPQSSPA